jgi:hypothetical protein
MDAPIARQTHRTPRSRTQIHGQGRRRTAEISRVGNRHLRKAFYMPALVASRLRSHAKAFSRIFWFGTKLDDKPLLPSRENYYTPYTEYFEAV